MDFLADLRDRLLGEPRLRDRIARLPFGRRIADRHARRLFGIVGGFVGSQMLAAGVELGVFEQLRGAPRSERDWAALTGLPDAGAGALLQALIATGLVERRRGGRVALTIDGLVVASDAGLRAMIAHDALLYADLADPVAMLRGRGGGRIAAFWPYAGGGGDPEGYARLMAASQSFVADSLLASVDFSQALHVMDVGGGDGRFLTALAVRCPQARLTLVDRPTVVPHARSALAANGMLERVAVVGVAEGEVLPTGADTITLVRVLHDQDDAKAQALVRAAAAALAPGGRLVVAEPMARAGRDPQTAYFAAYFAAMRSGRLRTPGAIARLMRTAALKPARPRHPSALLGVMIGVGPA